MQRVAAGWTAVVLSTRPGLDLLPQPITEPDAFMMPSVPLIPRTLLVGSDLSTASDAVIQQAAAIARRGGAALHVVSAYPPPTTAFGDGAGEVSEQVLQEVREALPAQLRRILPDDARPRSQEVRFGKPAAVILERAREVSADTIVLGPHRGADVHAQFLGTTADEVLRLADVPCLTLRGTLPIPVRRIGIATDFSGVTSRAFGWALGWASWVGAHTAGPAETQVTLVSVVPPAGGDSSAQAAGRLRHALESAPPTAPGQRIRTTSEVLVDADVAGTLARWAERSGLDLLVVGTHGRTGRRAQRESLGSVSSAIARRAPCPVLLVPGDDGRSG